MSWPIRALRFRQLLERQMKDVAALKGVRKVRYLGWAGGIAEYSAQTDNGLVWILQAQRDDPSEVAQNLQFAYRTFNSIMGRGPLGVPGDRAVIPEIGALVLDDPDGVRLSWIIRDGVGDEIEGLTRAGAWLAALHEGFEVRPGGFDALERADETTYPYRKWLESQGDGDRLEPLAEGAVELAQKLDGALVDYTKFHRTYSPRAVHIGETRTLVTELQATKRRPRCYDIAHFLLEAAFLAQNRALPRDDMGLPEGWLDAFLLGYGRSDPALLRMVRFALMARMIEVYIQGSARKRPSRTFHAKRDVIFEMAQAMGF
ncbi:MAG: hypothetical protein AAGJ96_08035 [Pseudomonadota bacterium]